MNNQLRTFQKTLIYVKNANLMRKTWMIIGTKMKILQDITKRKAKMIIQASIYKMNKFT